MKSNDADKSMRILTAQTAVRIMIVRPITHMQN